MLTTYDGQLTRVTPEASSVTGDTGIGRGETPVERRLREMAAQIRHDHANDESIGAADIDAGREALALLREPLTSPGWGARRAALLARCEGDR